MKSPGESEVVDFTLRYKDVPYLDVSSTYEAASGEIVINVVNRNKDKAISADVISQNGAFGSKFTWTFPAHSVTQIAFTVK